MTVPFRLEFSPRRCNAASHRMKAALHSSFQTFVSHGISTVRGHIGRTQKWVPQAMLMALAAILRSDSNSGAGQNRQGPTRDATAEDSLAVKKAFFIFALVGATSACAVQDSAKVPAAPAAVPPKASPLDVASYLGSTALPESLELIPAPPTPGSAAEARDEAGAAAALALRGSARWDLAKSDAELSPEAVASRFSCAAGLTIGKQATPALYKVIATAEPDLGIATSDVKKRYMRPRPFMKNGQPTCTPDWEAVLRRDGSYPSGHSSIGYGVGLILAEIIPDRAARLVARGRAFGDSRRICNVHWLSDIEEGRVVASATVMRFNVDPTFAADVAAARSEVERHRSSGAALTSDCNRESETLARQ